MKCPHCRFEWEPRRAARVKQSIMSFGPIILAVVLCVSFFTVVGLLVAYGETAVEIIPGVTHYGGHSTSVEIIPGHRQYYGEIKGSATEITPGIQHYHLERSSPYSKSEIQRDATRRYSPSSQIQTPSTSTLRGQ